MREPTQRLRGMWEDATQQQLERESAHTSSTNRSLPKSMQGVRTTEKRENLPDEQKNGFFANGVRHPGCTTKRMRCVFRMELASPHSLLVPNLLLYFIQIREIPSTPRARQCEPPSRRAAGVPVFGTARQCEPPIACILHRHSTSELELAVCWTRERSCAS